MLTYEYKCEKCGLKFEKLQSIKDEALKVCPDCSGEVKRLIGTGAAIVFKGSGSGAGDHGEAPPGRCRDWPYCGRDRPCEE
ncbi:MAG: zinc ribbon domain-containing protein [Phycisphaerae bacterium]|jgi:putative FmdB family regulatory protein|nr:zinc ribbon domain-containing protein [Phycisphaerae bacterium]MDP7636081.1 zinc ribbon domain-containing protein [Phycisphaerae bacterium]